MTVKVEDNSKAKEKAKAEQKIERQKNATAKRGRSITLLKKNEDTGMYGVVAGENDGMRTIADVKKWMEQSEYIGTLYPVRLQKAITRGEQTVIKFS